MASLVAAEFVEYISCALIKISDTEGNWMAKGNYKEKIDQVKKKNCPLALHA